MVDGYGVENGIVIDSNAVTSIHGRDNAVSKLLAEAISVEQSGRIGVYYRSEKHRYRVDCKCKQKRH